MDAKACIFDLDGTLLYTLASISKAGNEVLRHFGYPEEPEENYRFYCGDGADKLVERILERAGDSDEAHYREGCVINREVLKENARLGVHPYDGLEVTLRELKDRGLLLGVCSNKPNDAVQSIIPAVFGADLFDMVCGQADDMRLKPAPDMPLAVASGLGVEPQDCLYFGDSGTDMKTGRAAGMLTIGVRWGYRTEEELLSNGAQRLISVPEEMLSLPELAGR